MSRQFSLFCLFLPPSTLCLSSLFALLSLSLSLSYFISSFFLSFSPSLAPSFPPSLPPSLPSCLPPSRPPSLPIPLSRQWPQSNMHPTQVCIGVAGGMVIGSAKILFRANLMIIILTAYAIAAILTVFSSEEFTNIG